MRDCEFDGDPSKVDRKVIRNVNTVGWHVMVVTPQGMNPAVHARIHRLRSRPRTAL